MEADILELTFWRVARCLECGTCHSRAVCACCQFVQRATAWPSRGPPRIACDICGDAVHFARTCWAALDSYCPSHPVPLRRPARQASPKRQGLESRQEEVWRKLVLQEEPSYTLRAQAPAWEPPANLLRAGPVGKPASASAAHPWTDFGQVPTRSYRKPASPAASAPASASTPKHAVRSSQKQPAPLAAPAPTKIVSRRA